MSLLQISLLETLPERCESALSLTSTTADATLTSDGETTDTESCLDEEDYEPEIETAIAQSEPELKSPIRKSLFGSECDTLYFPSENERVSLLPKRYQSCLYYKVGKETPKVVKNALKALGFEFLTKGKKWLGYWGKHLSKDKYKRYQPFQSINHIPQCFEIGRKDNLYKNYKLLSRSFPRIQFDYIPVSYILPADRKYLERDWSTSKYWISKPCASARGLGIKLYHKSQKPPSKECIVSKFIRNPYLIHGRKFDLRVYVLVTSLDPLKVYVYEGGICRFASEQYEFKKTKISKFAYLTNYSVNKKNPKSNICESTNDYNTITSNKWDLPTLFEYLEGKNINPVPIFAQINSILLKTVMSITQNPHPCSPSRCYELFGFDILLDHKLKPYLMECNISPALKGSCDMDYKVKSKLVRDLFNTVGIKVSDMELAVQHFKRRKSGVSNQSSAATLKSTNESKNTQTAVKNVNQGVLKSLSLKNRQDTSKKSVSTQNSASTLISEYSSTTSSDTLPKPSLSNLSILKPKPTPPPCPYDKSQLSILIQSEDEVLKLNPVCKKRRI